VDVAAPGRARSRRARALQSYGITIEQYDELLRAQGGVCAACAAPPTEKRLLDVDHDHRTGRVRGLLCRRCNRALGSLRDDPELARKLATYLEITRAPWLVEALG